MLGASAAFAAGYTDNGKGITLQVKNATTDGARLVRLEVVNDDIIRVRATKEAAFPDKQSLVVVPQKATPKYKVTEKNGVITLKAKTSRLS